MGRLRRPGVVVAGDVRLGPRVVVVAPVIHRTGAERTQVECPPHRLCAAEMGDVEARAAARVRSWDEVIAACIRVINSACRASASIFASSFAFRAASRACSELASS